jgi:hypothetical protein
LTKREETTKSAIDLSKMDLDEKKELEAKDGAEKPTEEVK